MQLFASFLLGYDPDSRDPFYGKPDKEVTDKYNEWLKTQGGEVQNAPPEVDIGSLYLEDKFQSLFQNNWKNKKKQKQRQNRRKVNRSDSPVSTQGWARIFNFLFFLKIF